MLHSEILPLDLGNDVWFHLISNFVLQVEFRLFHCKPRSRPVPGAERVKSNVSACLQSGGPVPMGTSSNRVFPRGLAALLAAVEEGLCLCLCLLVDQLAPQSQGSLREPYWQWALLRVKGDSCWSSLHFPIFHLLIIISRGHLGQWLPFCIRELRAGSGVRILVFRSQVHQLCDLGQRTHSLGTSVPTEASWGTLSPLLIAVCPASNTHDI